MATSNLRVEKAKLSTELGFNGVGMWGTSAARL